MKKPSISRRTQSGVYSLAISLVMIAVVIGLNLLFSLLPESAVKIDTTAERLYTVSEQTKQVLSGLSEDVSLYLIVEPGKEDNYVVNLLGRYAQLSDHIKLQMINPLLHPTFTAQYTDQTVENNGVIVYSAERSMLVQKNDMFEYGFDYTYYTNATVFNGERKITGAIGYVTQESVPAVYLLGGHGEAALSDRLSDAITTENFDQKSLDLRIAGSIPTDAAAVAIVSPQSDLSTEEATALQAYLDNGGRLLFISGYCAEPLTNLYAVLAAFGIEPVQGVVIEGDGAHSISGYAYYLLPTLQQHAITEPLIASGAEVVVPTAMGLSETASHRSTLRVTPLLTTSDKAYCKADPYATQTFDREADDKGGPFHVAMASEESFGDTNIRLVWIGSDQMILDPADDIVSGSNVDFVVNALGWMCDKEDSIQVRAKSTLTNYLTVTTALKNTMGAVITVLLPGAALAAGAAIYAHRRRRK
ncbi:MAG: GldG family protein [Christensenella sp.]|nr:GldG family protein [Christensenella sp.]